MQVEIKYCVVCGLAGRARRLARRIADEIGVEAKLTSGPLGEFDVIADGTLIASRRSGLLNHLTYRGWPDEDAVLARLRERAGQPAGAVPPP